MKLAGQVAAALVAVGSGLMVRSLNVPGIGGVELGWAAGPLTLCWILFVTNAMNFIDGLNGLAAGVSALTALALSGIAAAHGAWFVYFAGLLLASGLAGFLPFNFPRARIFLGDVGSQFCGFVLAVLTVAAGRLDTGAGCSRGGRSRGERGRGGAFGAVGADAAVRRAVGCGVHARAPVVGAGGGVAGRIAGICIRW